MSPGVITRPDYEVDPATGCWVWQKSTLRGYPVGRRGKAHRWYYEDAYGPIPENHDIHHLCRNTLCVNPEHLEAVHERMHDLKHMLREKGRDIAYVRQIRAERAAGASFRTIAARHGLPYTTVKRWCGNGIEPAWQDLVGHGEVLLPERICARHDCDRPVVGRPDKRFCSGRCRTVHNQRIRRAAEASVKTEELHGGR